ncbi:helix-turn-helix transcriptional regulator [Vibrio maritimus]
MAERIGVTRRTYISIEQGESDPRATVIAQIAHITHQPIAWYFP